MTRSCRSTNLMVNSRFKGFQKIDKRLQFDMADTEALYVVFDTFCNFGSARNLNASSNKLAGPTMEGFYPTLTK